MNYLVLKDVFQSLAAKRTKPRVKYAPYSIASARLSRSIGKSGNNHNCKMEVKTRCQGGGAEGVVSSVGMGRDTRTPSFRSSGVPPLSRGT